MRPSQAGDAVYLQQMIDCIERIESFSKISISTSDITLMRQDAVLRNLHVLTECSQRLSAHIKSEAPEIPWNALAGFRNVVVHNYLSLDDQIIQRVVLEELPILRRQLETLLSSQRS